MTDYHKPALLEETLQGLAIKPDGCYVDATYGGGGHARAILDELSEKGLLLAFDQDPDARANLVEDKRLLFVPQNFIYLKNFLKVNQIQSVDGILADFGVSFHQFDQAERGFSFRFDGPLDMRMDQKRELTAAKILNDYSEEKLQAVLKKYGELKNLSAIVKRLMAYRKEGEFTTTTDLKTALADLVPVKHEHKFLAQVFQALRIEVNEELVAIERFLEQSVDLLNKDGRLVLITYHSLEDRLVKNFIRTGNFQAKQEKDFYGNLIRPLEPINRKPIVPSDDELMQNKRARSAKLRIAKKAA